MVEEKPAAVVRFLADVHVSLAIVAQVRLKTAGQIDLVRWGERGEKLDADDDDIWASALAERRVVVTGDRGFLKRIEKAGQHPGVVYIHPQAQGDASIGPAVELLTFLHEAVSAGAATLAEDIDNHVWRIKR